MELQHIAVTFPTLTLTSRYKSTVQHNDLDEFVNGTVLMNVVELIT